MTIDLRDLIEERINAVPPAAGDIDRVRSAGRRIRRRRRTGVASVATALVLAGGTWAVIAEDDPMPGEDMAPDRTSFASLGALDFSEGVRAYGDPGKFVSLGGRKIPAEDLEWLDTDAVATVSGIVFFDDGRPMLLDGSGDYTELVKGPLDQAPGFHPTAKAEAAEPVVAWATLRDGQATITVRNLATGEDVANVRPDCDRCSDLVIDGIDGGVVFVRDSAGTRTWDSATGEWSDFAGSETRVADVRNGVVLYTGPVPTDPGEWSLVAGAVDSQLSYDGGHVLSWSSTLEPTTPDRAQIVLERGPAVGDGPGWWTFDTDGSVLVATGKNYGGDYTVYDCVLPAGACEEIGALAPNGGDPMFIGNDM